MRSLLRSLVVPTALIAFISIAPSAHAQVSLTALGTPYTQNFDTLPATGSATWTNNSTIAGWYHARTGTGTTIVANDGSSNAGNLYSYGTGTATDRALGSLGSGNAAVGNIFYGVRLQNNTGATITSLDVTYTGEQWRNSAGAAQTIAFSYLIGSPTVTGSLAEFQSAGVAVTALDFTSPITGGAAGALNGNLAANRTALTFTISGLSIPNGTEVMLRWSDPDQVGADHGLGIDDVSITPNAGAPLPSLTVNDVSLNEGNAGTTNYTFTVSLSAPAGPGGVTFDIATADGTATAPSDYTAKSLTAQTIPAGSSTYSFTVLGNGDITPETSETFFANVTNVTGANVGDGQGQATIVNDDAAPNLTINDVSLNEGNAGTTTFTFTVSLSAPAPAGGVTFDIATADGTATAPSDYTQKSLTSQTIPAGSSTYTFDVLVNGDSTPESDETFFVNVANATNAIVTDGQGLGTIVNDELTRIHDVQGNGAATPIPGATVSVEGVVIANFQGANQLSGFFLQEEDADADADPNTSEGIFVFCGGCTTPVAEGQRVRATGTVSEFNGLTEITASAAGSVVVTAAGNHLGEVTPSVITLPIVGDLDAFYEARESMLVTFADTLTVSEYFELERFGQIVLYQGGRPRQFTETAAPSPAGYAASLDAIARREVILDDDNNAQEGYLLQPDGQQSLFYPQANGGFGVGTQGVDFFRGGDVVNGLTGVLQWSFPGFGASTWRIRPAAAHPVTFTVANPRPATAPVVGGAIKAASMNLLNYFTTIDTTASNSTGPCAPSGTQDCRGADSVAELNRQRERASIVVCTLNADVYGFMELENTTPTATITDLLGAVNARCGGAHPYTFVNTGGTLGTDAIRVMLAYRTGILSPVDAPLVDLDPIHNRPPTAQTFDVVDATNSAFGQRFTVIANHFKSKGCDASATGADADAGDGQSCYAGRRTAQASRLLTWINSTVLPAAGDPDVLLLGDFNAYAQETPTTTIESGGFTDVESALLGANAYSYLFDGQLGHIDYAFASASLFAQVTGVGPWHINADEVSTFDYNDEVKDAGEATFEEKPDGSALVPPRVVFQPATPYRASDHDPVLLGLFAIADLAVTNTDAPDPVTAGANLTYTITVTNNGPDAATSASWTDTLPAGTTFVSLPAVAGWSCTTPAVGSAGTVSCSNPSFAVGSAVFTLTVAVAPTVAAGSVLSDTATATSTTGDGNPGNESGTATTTVAASADLSVTNTDAPDPVTAGTNLTYTITATNAGPSVASSVSLTDTLPANTTFVSLALPAGWSCTTPAVGTSGTVSCSVASLAVGSAPFTLIVAVDATTASGTVLSDTATVASATSDPNAGNESGTATTTVGGGAADLSVTNVDTPDPVTAGANLTYTITATNAGPSSATTASVSDTLPPNTTFVSLVSPGTWSCATPAVGGTGTVTCTNASFGIGSAVFTLTVAVDAATANGTVIADTATVSSASIDPNPGNGSATATTTVSASADLSATIALPASAAGGSTVNGTFACTNNGPSAASAANCAVSGLPAGASVVCVPTVPVASLAVGATINCTIAFTAPASGAVTAIATASSATADANAANNTASATTTITAAPQADLVATISLPTTATAGSTVTGAFACTNNGPDAAINATCDIVGLPAGAVVACTPAPPVGSLASGASINCTVSFVAPSSGTVTAIVTAGSATSDPNPASNVASTPIVVGGGGTTTPVAAPIDARWMLGALGGLLMFAARRSLASRRR